MKSCISGTNFIRLLSYLMKLFLDLKSKIVVKTMCTQGLFSHAGSCTYMLYCPLLCIISNMLTK